MTRSFLYIVFFGLLFSCRDSGDAVGDNSIASNLDGKLVFQSNRTGDFEIFMTHKSGTGITNISQDAFDDLNPSMSLSGNKLAYVSSREGAPHIYIFEDNNSKKVTGVNAEYSSPQISHRGDKIIFIRNYNLYVMNASGTGITQLTFNSGDTVNYSPAFSFDDSKIVFTRNIKGGNADIILMSGLGGAMQNLTNGMGDNLYPAFSPDGNKVVFSRNNHISILTIATKSVADLMPADSLQFNSHPVFSPDGSAIAFVTNRTGNMEIFTMNTNGHKLKNITENEDIDTFPYWSN